MAVQTFTRPHDYDPSVTKEVVVGEPHKIPASAPYHIFLRHVPRQQTPSTVKVSGGGITWTEVSTPPSASGQYRVRYDEALGRIEFHASDAGREITVSYNACGTVVWGEKHDDGRPNIAEMQEVLERVQEAGGIDYGSSGFANVRTALDALVGVRIVEMGSNSNGTYVRWENGLQVCWHSLGGARSTTTVTGPLYRDDAATTWTFPAAFTASPTVYGTVVRSATDDDYRLFFAPHSFTTTAVTYRDVATASAPALGRNDQLLALGRWK